MNLLETAHAADQMQSKRAHPSEPEPKSLIEQRAFSAPFSADGSVILNPQLSITRQPYLLQEHELLILREGNGRADTFGNGFLLAAFISLLRYVFVWIGYLDAPSSPLPSALDLLLVVSFALIGLLFLGVSKWLPNRKRELVSKLDQHFQKDIPKYYATSRRNES